VIIWLDAHISPSIARWIAETFAVECVSARDLGLRDALDPMATRSLSWGGTRTVNISTASEVKYAQIEPVTIAVGDFQLGKPVPVATSF